MGKVIPVWIFCQIPYGQQNTVQNATRPAWSTWEMRYGGDIYLSSDDGANGLQSVYNSTPITGTEGLNWYIAGERARRVGKRLPDYMEFTVAADGSPQGLDNSMQMGGQRKPIRPERQWENCKCCQCIKYLRPGGKCLEVVE